MFPRPSENLVTNGESDFESHVFTDGYGGVGMVGVPTINDTPSCPPLLEQRQACEPQPFNVMGDNTPASSFKAQWGVDISGKLEAEIISGIFAELS